MSADTRAAVPFPIRIGVLFPPRTRSRLGGFRFEIDVTGFTIPRMSSAGSPVDTEVVRKVAALARLRVPEEDLPAWAGQLGRILSYIDQLAEIRERPRASEPPVESTPLRRDEPAAGGGKRALEENAPAIVHGYGSVPRVVGGSTP